jgi:hypothetical protein
LNYYAEICLQNDVDDSETPTCEEMADNCQVIDVAVLRIHLHCKRTASLIAIQLCVFIPSRVQLTLNAKTPKFLKNRETLIFQKLAGGDCSPPYQLAIKRNAV